MKGEDCTCHLFGKKDKGVNKDWRDPFSLVIFNLVNLSVVYLDNFRCS